MINTCRNRFLSIVIPTYNEADRILATLESVVAFLRLHTYGWEVIVVDDGSYDKTPSIVSHWVEENIVEGESCRVILVDHEGKGSAVKVGMLAASGTYKLMCDADLAVSAEQIGKFVRSIERGNYDIVIGSRQIEGAQRFHDAPLRYFMGRLFNWYVRVIAVSGFQDTQCGYKCFTEESAAYLFQNQRVKGWGFDVEILFLASKKNMTILEMPVSWRHVEKSKVQIHKASLEMARDTLLVRLRYLFGRYK